jgi:hypothetical protein
MGQFSLEKPVAPGSALSGNQHAHRQKDQILFAGVRDSVLVGYRRRTAGADPVEGEKRPMRRDLKRCSAVLSGRVMHWSSQSRD